MTDCFILSELFSVARHVGRSKPGSKPIQLYVRLNLRPLSQREYHVGKGNFKGIYVATAAASVCLYSYTLSATRVLNSFEELCIMRAAAENSFPRVLNPHGGASVFVCVCVCVLSKSCNWVGWLVGWVLRYINLCWLFNAKSIFMQIVWSISNNSV